jgi:hypothetical protein
MDNSMTSTHTGRALQYVRLNSFKASKGDRGNIPNFLVVITDGRSKGVYNVTTESIDLHNSNIEIFSVGIYRIRTNQWPKEKVQKNKQRSTKHTHKTKARVTRIPLKPGLNPGAPEG